MDADRYHAVVDLGGTRVRAALVDSSMQLLNRVEENTNHERGPEGVVDQIARMITSCRRGIDDQPVSLVIATPGPSKPAIGMVCSPPNLPGWGDVPLKAMLEAAIGIPTRIVNDASVAAVGEFHFGSGRGFRNLVYLTISTGIGGGVVIEGVLLEGTSGAGAEIGHMTIDRHGPICKCGNIGCLEALASGLSIARRFQEALDAGGKSGLTAELEGRPASAADIARAAAGGDPLAATVFRDAAMAIGTGVVNCIHIFNPDVVALGGGVTLAGPLLFDTVREMVSRYALAVPRDDVKVVPAELGEDVGLMGAAAIALASRVS
jgi:glucokinase